MTNTKPLSDAELQAIKDRQKVISPPLRDISHDGQCAVVLGNSAGLVCVISDYYKDFFINAPDDIAALLAEVERLSRVDEALKKLVAAWNFEGNVNYHFLEEINGGTFQEMMAEAGIIRRATPDEIANCEYDACTVWPCRDDGNNECWRISN
jgi:hypothetical protein